MVQKKKNIKKKSTPDKVVSEKKVAKGKNKGWVEVSAGEIHDFETDGIELTGIYSGLKVVNIPTQGDSNLYNMTTEEGEKKFWGSTILDTAMARIKEGAKIRILFNGRGKKKGKKQAPKLFKVFVQSDKDLLPF